MAMIIQNFCKPSRPSRLAGMILRSQKDLLSSVQFSVSQRYISSTIAKAQSDKGNSNFPHGTAYSQPQKPQRPISRDKQPSILDDMLQHATTSKSEPRNIRRHGGGSRGGASQRQRGGASTGPPRHRTGNHQGLPFRHQGGIEPPRQAVKAYTEWKLKEIKKLQQEFEQHISQGHIAEGGEAANEIRLALQAAKNDLRPEEPIVSELAPDPQGGFRRQYSFDVPPLLPFVDSGEKMPGTIRTFAVYSKRVSNMTRGGRRPSMFALVLAGNGMGACGFATAKGSEARIAEEKAEKRAIRNLQFIPRLDDRTIAHDVQAKFLKTKVFMRPARPDAGVKAHPLIQIMCDLAGITDMTADVIGSRNPMNIVRAAMEGFASLQDPIKVAESRRKTLIQVDDPGVFPRVLYTPPEPAPVTPLPGDIQQSVKRWIQTFPDPGNMDTLVQGKRAFDAIWDYANTTGTIKEPTSSCDHDSAIPDNMSDHIVTWMSQRPKEASILDIKVFARGSFLDDSFWPCDIDVVIERRDKLQRLHV